MRLLIDCFISKIQQNTDMSSEELSIAEYGIDILFIYNFQYKWAIIMGGFIPRISGVLNNHICFLSKPNIWGRISCTIA